MNNATLLHARWCAYGLTTAILLGGCASSTGDTGEIAQSKQAQVVVTTTPVNVNLTLPAGVNSSSVLLAASNQLTLNGAGTVGNASRLTAIAGLGSNTQLMIQAGSQIFGNIISGSLVTVSSNATVFGSARSGGDVVIQPGAEVLGSVTRNSAPGQSGLDWVVNWPNDAGTAVNREPLNGTLTAGAPGEAIAPGHYSTFNIKSRNRMKFSTGTYFIETFNLEPSAEIMIDSSKGSVIVYVKSSFRYYGSFLPVRNSAGVPIVREGGVRVVYLGTSAADITGPFVGVLLAPNADINLNSPNSGQHKGGFFGHNITVSANGNSSLLPLDFDLNDFTSGQTKYGDADNDGTTDDKDLCPRNPNKVAPGVCGCNVADTDANGDGIPDCIGTGSEFCTGKTAGTPCYSTICPNNKAKETCGTNGVCGNPVTECAPDNGGATSSCSYKIFQTSVYWICNNNVTWQAADAACSAVPGRNLVHIDGRTENSWLDFVTSSNMWIGASSTGSSSSWSWTQGTDDGAFPFWAAGSSINGRFNHWQSGQPANGTCGTIQADGTWASQDCATTQGFICEQPLDVAQSTHNGNICDFYPGATCPGTITPVANTCVPATDVMAGDLANFKAVTNDCDNNCTDSSMLGTPACDDHCQGVFPIPSDSDRCPTPIGVVRPVCNIAQTGYGAACTPGVTTCSGGQTCGRIYACAQLDASNQTIPCKQNSDCSTNSCHPTHKVCMDPSKTLSDDPNNPNWSYATNTCFASYYCGTPTDNFCDTNYFVQGIDPCNEVEICSDQTAHGVFIDPQDPDNHSNLNPTVFNPDTAFQQPDAPVATPFAEAKPNDCGDPDQPCSFGSAHPWCNPQVSSDDNKVKSQAVADNGSTDDKKGHAGGTGTNTGPVTFDFDPNLALSYNITPSLFGDSTFYADATASVSAAVHLNKFLSFSADIDVIDALGEIKVDRCGLKVDAHTKVLGVDFLPTIMGSSYDDLHKFDTDDATRKQCEAGIAQFQTEVARVAKALRDAQELIRQYQALPSGSTLDSNFCATVISGYVPWDFPKLDCSTATPDAVVNAFIDYYAQQAVALAGKGIDSASLPSFNGQTSSDIALMGDDGHEDQNLLNLPFTIGPIPMNLTVDAYLTYGIAGGFHFGLTPDAFLQTFKNRDPADLASARANAVPHASAGIEMFVGAGFDCGFASAKIGISGNVTVADITVPLTAGAYLNVRSEPEDRPLSADLTAANGSANYEVYFPPVGPSRFVFGAGYEYDAEVTITDILHGEIDAQLKLKFFFFSKTWRVKIAEFAGLQGPHYQLLSGTDLSGVNLGAVSMPLPFLKLPHVTALPATAVTKVPFDASRVENLFYDNQCTIRSPTQCPRIFGTVPNDVTSYDPEQSNLLAAYGTTGFTVGNNVYMWSKLVSSNNYNGDMAIGTATGTGSFASGDYVGDVYGGKSVTYPTSSYPGSHPYGTYYPGTGTGFQTRQVPAIVLNTQMPSTPYTRPLTVNIPSGSVVQYLPGDYAGTVTVQSGGQLILDGSGQYFFDDLFLQPGGNILINHGTATSGAVEVAILGKSIPSPMVWQGTITNGSGRANAHVIGFYGSAAVTLNGGFNGTFVAPNAAVTLAPAYYLGAFYAKTLTIQAGTQIAFLPCHPFIAPPPIIIN